MHDVIIIGGGPAGLTAALYASRAGKSVLLLEKNTFGGQITWSPKVENFPTIPCLSGMDFADRLTAQVSDYDVELELDEAADIIKTENGFTVKTAFGSEFQGKALIAATGAKPRRLGLENEESYIGSGVSFCAVCDGDFFREKTVAVNGGGNTAVQEALYLSKLCKKVYLIHRRDSFRADSALTDALETHPNIERVLNSSITALHGEGKLSSVTLDNGQELETDGLFIAIGHEPENEIFKNLIELNSAGYADSGENCVTVCPGLFVAGDFRQKEVRQLTTAMADGATAALAACKYIDSSKN